MLPDVTVAREGLADIRLDLDTVPGRRLLRLSASTPNIGDGPLEIRGGNVLSAERQEVLQRIHREDGSFWERAAGTSTYHPTHGHIHFDAWAMYRLRTRTPDGGAGSVVAEGAKTSFCLLDLAVYDSGAAGPARYLTCGQTLQGISPGWADVYDRELPDQWIDVSGVPDGRYWLEAEVDPENRILETAAGEANNVARIEIELALAPAATPDAFEPNDSPVEVRDRPPGAPNSPNLGLLTEPLELGPLSLEDEADYFAFELEQVLPPGAQLRVESPYLGSDLDVFLFDADDLFVAASTRRGNIEHVALAGLAPGQYFAMVFSYSGHNPGYRLRIDPVANRPPQIEVRLSGTRWIERAFEAVPIEWTSTDPDGDATSVALYLARDRVLDKASVQLGGYQRLPGEAGRAALNTAALELGTWFLFAEATDSSGNSAGAWAPDGFVLYIKGDLDGDGRVERADWQLYRRARRRAGRRCDAAASVIHGGQYLLDLDRDGDVDTHDESLFAREVFRRDHGAPEH